MSKYGVVYSQAELDIVALTYWFNAALGLILWRHRAIPHDSFDFAFTSLCVS